MATILLAVLHIKSVVPVGSDVVNTFVKIVANVDEINRLFLRNSLCAFHLNTLLFNLVSNYERNST